MKKILNLKFVFIMLIVALISSISVYAASTIYANQISYKDTNVKEALDDIYSKVVSGGSGTSTIISDYTITTSIAGPNIHVAVGSNIANQAKWYIYLLNDTALTITTNNTYDISYVNFDRNINYKVSVIAIDEKGDTKKSNESAVVLPEFTQVLANSIGATNGTYSAYNYYSEAWKPAYAFDGDDSTTWGSVDHSIAGNWIQYTFNQKIYVDKIRILNRTEGGYYITSCDIQASNDNFQTYTTIAELRNMTQSESKEVTFNYDEKYYKSYRVYINSSSGTMGVGLRAFDIYGHYYE